ncbi:unnamed protein product, partial [Polarella glacialis]
AAIGLSRARRRAREPLALGALAAAEPALRCPSCLSDAVGRWLPAARRRLWLVVTALSVLLLRIAPASAAGAVGVDALCPHTLFKFLVCGGMGCCISHAAATPLDVVKTRLQSDPERYRHSVTGEKLGTLAT